MSKSDSPAFRMTIENGRLVPATAYDQERLNSYRRGTIVFARFTEERDRVLVRKWWAVIGLVVKQCETPWKNKGEASEAIKLALGIVNLSKTIGGQFMQYPKSLTELTDPELQDAVEQMIGLLSRMTGVDVETLKKEAADVGNDIDHDAETGELIDNESPETGSVPVEPGADAPPQASAKEPEGESPPSSGSDIFPTDRADLIECCRKMLAIPVDPDLTQVAQRGVLESTKDAWKERLPAELHDHIRSFFVSADAQIKADRKVLPTLREKALSLFSEFLDCTVDEIGGA